MFGEGITGTSLRSRTPLVTSLVGFRTLHRTPNDMQDLPHRYRLEAMARSDGNVVLSAQGLPSLESAPPAEFDGPGDLWSPESLLLAAVADCFVLSFRTLAANSSLGWSGLRCGAEGVLDRAEGGMRFTEIHLHAELELDPGQKRDRAQRLLERAEKICLVSNSLVTPVLLKTEISESA